MGPHTSVFVLFLLSPLSYCKASEDIFVFIALPPQPFKQACDEYNDDGLDALYHHLVLVPYESQCHIIMKYSSTLSFHPCALPL